MIDPDGPPPPKSGLYGLDPSFQAASAIVFPVPFEATVSYRAGTRRGPEAIRRASHQVDLCDVDVGDAAAGIRLEAPLEGAEDLSKAVRPLALRVIEAVAEGRAPDPAWLAAVDDAGETLRARLFAEVERVLDAGKLPVVLGGDHSVPLGAIEAVAKRQGDAPLGILHVDAHADLRERYEGFLHSHASILHNVLERVPNARLVQVGIRDFSAAELRRIQRDARITTYFDAQLRPARLSGRIGEVLRAAVETLPEHVYVSFDIDGLDPALCPHTGTPVPGGLSFDEAVTLLEALAKSGRRVVGADLCEVAPSDDDEDAWDAAVGARLLLKLVGFALMSRGVPGVGPAPLPRPPGLV